jgi:hypothetical protein
MDTQKTPASRRRVIQIGSGRTEDLEEIVSKTVNKTLDQIEDGYEHDEEDFATEEEFEESTRKDVKQINEENPFILAERLVEQGIDIEFNIKKGGRYLTKVDDPEFNEEKLQQFGEGTYTVALYKLTPKRAFVKQQTFRVASAPISQNQERKTNETHLAEIMVQQTNEQIKAMREEFAEKERRLEDQRKEEKRIYDLEKKEAREREEKREEERRRNEGNSKNSLLETITVLKELMPKAEDKSDKFMEMMMKMQENTQTLLSKMDEKNKEMIKESQDRLEKLIDKLGNKGDTITERELRQEIDKARREGKEDYKEMLELAEVKAVERAELLSGKEPEEKEKESMTDTLIKSALPMLMQTMARRPAPMIAPPQQRRQIAPPVRTAPQAPKRPVTAPATKPVQQARPPVKTAPQAPKTQPVTVMTGGNAPIMDLSGLNLKQTPKTAILHTEEEKTAVGQLLMEVVGAGVMEKTDPKKISNIAFHALKKENLLSERVFDYYPKSELYALKEQFSLDIEDNWIETFYEDLKEKFNTNGEHV